MDCEITARAASVLLQPLSLVVRSLFLSNLEMKAKACKCSDPLF